MHPTLSDFTSAEIAAAIDHHLTDTLAVMGRDIPDAEFSYGPKGLCTLTGLPSPYINYIGGKQWAAEEAETQIAETLARIQKLGVPAFWFVGPNAKPDDLGELLQTQGMQQVGAMPGMALDLATLTMPSLPPNTILQEVRDAAMLETWVTTLSEGYELGREIAAALAHGFHRFGFGESSPMRAFLALHNDRPVACSCVHLAHGIAGIYCVATLPEARRQGFGAAVTAEPLRIARDLGYHVGVLHASPMGAPVYQHLGFQEYCRISLYLYSPS